MIIALLKVCMYYIHLRGLEGIEIKAAVVFERQNIMV